MHTDIRKKLGKEIRHLRKLRQMTQEQLGEKSGLSYKFIGEIERGEVNPSLESLAGIAAALNLHVKELFPDEAALSSELSPNDLQIIKKAVKLLNRHLNVKHVKRL